MWTVIVKVAPSIWNVTVEIITMIHCFYLVKFCFRPVGFNKGEKEMKVKIWLFLQMTTTHTHIHTHADKEGSLNFELYSIWQEALLLEIILLSY